MKIIKLLFFYGFLISINLLEAQDYSHKLNNHFDKLINNGELLIQDVSWEISSEHKSSISNINHVYFYQSHNGIEINNTLSSIHFQFDGKTISSNNYFIKNISEKIKGTTSPKISAIEAVQIISKKNDYLIKEPLNIIESKENLKGYSYINKSGISLNDIPVKLVFVKNKRNDIVLSWKLTILEINREHWWDYYVNAINGEIMAKKDNIFECSYEYKNENKKIVSNINFNVNSTGSFLNCEKCYEVIPMPIESPYYGERSIVYNPVNYFASPLGWHSDDDLSQEIYSITRGNNINAFIGNEDLYEYQPNGGNNLNFTNYQFNQNFNENLRYENASITNLFYWGNIIHDVLYQYGFNEISGNFQVNNFEKGGVENDLVDILGQEDLNLCNARIGISRDGIKPFITSNICGDKDGSFDNIVLIHEYIHGVSFRLTGGANSDNCLTTEENLAEGWSDWYALMMTMNPNDIGTTPRGIATFFFNQGENGEGIRDYPYTTDMNSNPQTYGYINFQQGIHQVGSVWTTMLWELTWVLIEEFGYDENIYNFSGNIELDAGNIIALAIVTEGMKLQPCEPGFVDGRDAIFAAFQSIYGAEYSCLIWEAFAKRGLGYYASQGTSFSLLDGYESFEMPPSQATFDQFHENICINTDVVYGLGGGFPLGGYYSGPGVIDDGNGLSFTFKPSEVGIGTHVIYYEVYDGVCTEASIDSGSLVVIEDSINPVILCYDDIIVTIPENEDFYTLPNYSSNVLTNDNCFTNPIITQSPLEGDNIDIGDTKIVMTSVDGAGNETNCTFNVTVKRNGEEEIIDTIFEVYPNPTTGELIIYSDEVIEVLTANIFDLNGRLIKTYTFNEFGLTKGISIEELASGMYFFKFESKDFNSIKKILKE